LHASTVSGEAGAGVSVVMRMTPSEVEQKLRVPVVSGVMGRATAT
jgi:hypothetical protein